MGTRWGDKIFQNLQISHFSEIFNIRFRSLSFVAKVKRYGNLQDFDEFDVAEAAMSLLAQLAATIPLKRRLPRGYWGESDTQTYCTVLGGTRLGSEEFTQIIGINDDLISPGQVPSDLGESDKIQKNDQRFQ